MAVTQHTIDANLARIRECIMRATETSGRKAEDVTLIAATKMQSAEAIELAYNAGVRHFGENRVQEFEGKKPKLAHLKATWHLIGHLQSNKLSRAIRLFDCIDTLDSPGLARKMNRESPSHLRLPVLIEVRMDETAAAKSGVREEQVPETAEAILAMDHLELKGLLCVPAFFPEADQGRIYFRKLRNLRDALERRYNKPLPTLSMGMSHDFEVAIEEGATQIRIGTALFGARPPR